MGIRPLFSFALLGLALTAASRAAQPLKEAAPGYPAGVLASASPAGPADLQTRLRDDKSILLRSGAFDPLSEPLPDFLLCTSTASPRSPRGANLVQFTRDLSAAERSSLEGEGLRFQDYIPHHAYVVVADAAGLERLRRHPLHRWTGVLRGPYKVDPLLMGPGWAGPLYLEFRLFQGENPLLLLARLQALLPELTLAGTLGDAESGPRLRVLVPAERLHPFLEMASEDESVWSVSPWFLPRPQNDNSVWVIQSYDLVHRTSYDLSATIWSHGITGTGQVACINDSGIDHDMCYFRLGNEVSTIAEAQNPVPPDPGRLDPGKKIIAYAVLPGSEAYDGFAFFGHGTHTSCSVAGDNFATPSTPTSGGHDNGDGMAPNARIFFQDSGNESSGFLAGLSTDYALIFQQAYNAGARVHSDSWGSATWGVYTADCESVDRYLYRNEDFQIFFSSGNAGPGSGSVGSPAAAKNCVTVGAVTNGSEGADAVAGFSSRGPVKDGRIKPDVCAPGEDVNSAMADSGASDNCLTVSMSGTSMAAPTAAGGAVLLRQYFADGFYPTGVRNAADRLNPSAALLKAALVCGAMDVGIRDFPNQNEGFGRIQLDNVCFFSTPVRDALGTRVWDKRNAAGLVTGEEEEFPVQVSSDRPLKAVLAWTDPESSSLSAVNLVNDLDLEVVSPTGSVYRGNSAAAGESIPDGYPDRLNNVEMVFVPNPAAGAWKVRVVATSVPGTPAEPYSGRQGYALVVTRADCLSSLPSPAGLGAADNGATGIDLAWETVPGATRYQIYRARGGCAAEQASFHYVAQTAGTSYRDPLVQGGYTYSYEVRAADDCAEGSASPCASATYTGDCRLHPEFAGVASAANDFSQEVCAVRLDWRPASSACPSSPSISYNIYRGISPYFAPGPATRIAAGVRETSFLDDEVGSLVTYYYIIRAEDGSTAGGGPANGGNEDTNTAWKHATTSAGTYAPGAWTDDGGDTTAFLTLEAPWTVTHQDNHTPGGSLSYHPAKEGSNYPANVCASAISPNIPLQEGAPLLSYWVRYNLETSWDGVVVEVSTDDGATWTPSAPAGGYPGTFALTGSLPVNACLYPAEQGCITGPLGNSALTAWTRYTHDLSAYAARVVRIRWRFSTDPGTDYEGLYLDDIQVTSAGTPEACVMKGDEPPQVRVSSPGEGSTVHGVVTLTAQATDDHAVASVQFLVNGTSLDTLTSPPWSAAWDTSGLSGSYSIEAKARDNLGQSATSSPLTLVAENPAAAAVKKMGNPFRLVVTGSGFQSGCQILLANQPVPETQWKSASKAVAMKGGPLKGMVPAGTAVPVVVVNPDGGRTAPLLFSR